MVRNKSVILPFLFLAWTIIFAHSIVPHHHHVQETRIKTAHHSHEHDHTDHQEIDTYSEGFHKCDHDCHEHVCHFHVEVLTQISIDKIFIANLERTFLNYKPLERKNNYIYISEIVFEQLPKTDHLRGPPVLI